MLLDYIRRVVITGNYYMRCQQGSADRLDYIRRVVITGNWRQGVLDT